MDSRVESGSAAYSVLRQAGLNFIAPRAFEEKLVKCPTNFSLSSTFEFVEPGPVRQNEVWRTFNFRHWPLLAISGLSC